MHCWENRMPSRPGSSTQRLYANLNKYDDRIKYSRSIGILYRQKASSSVSLIFFSALRLRLCLLLYTKTKTLEISPDDKNICQKWYHLSEQSRNAASWKWVRILKSLGLCKIPPSSAISAQVVAKSFRKPATKICWYLLFQQTWPREHVCRKNPVRKAVFFSFSYSFKMWIEFCLVWWRSVGSHIRWYKGKQAIALSWKDSYIIKLDQKE